MIKAQCTTPQIIGEALEIYKKLPPRMADTVDDWLEDRPRAILVSKFEVLDAWLEYTGIIGYGEDFREIFWAYGVK